MSVINMNYKISVIMPVYNVEKYLDTCIESVVSQTYTNLEIILIDDGSTDKSLEICKRWESTDDRIIVIHTANRGGGAARNEGLKIASGEVITFIDSDDFICTSMYDILLGLMDDSVDVVECDFCETNSNDAKFVENVENSKSYSTVEAMKYNIDDTLFRQLIWNKIYRKKCVENIWFPEEKGIDDEFWTYRVLANAKKLVHTNCVLYAYRQQETSVMHSIGYEKRLRMIDARVDRHNFIAQNMPEVLPISKRKLWESILYIGQYTYRNVPTKEKSNTISNLKKLLKEYPIFVNDRGYMSLKERIWFLGMMISFESVCKIRNYLKIGL